MKVCETCGDEIGTRDGESKCQTCEEKAARGVRNAKARANRRARDAAMRDCGMVKVRGAMGGVYWE